MVPVTAIPYAAARLEECSKLTMTMTTETYSSQLMNGLRKSARFHRSMDNAHW